MYNSRSGFTSRKAIIYAETDTGSVKIYWDDMAESTTDVLTGYSDFEGYKIYKSVDGGSIGISLRPYIRYQWTLCWVASVQAV